ncbi:MAG: type II toxin-antitoxin system PemK/MazF family toxin [Methanobacteriaceae archaeon]|nr:type II toxin-antitoxin system PemK/MazF family toxin [Methanobacteriaceae archaeon]
MNINRIDICIVDLEPTIGSEMKKRRSIVLISTNSINSVPKFN